MKRIVFLIIVVVTSVLLCLSAFADESFVISLDHFAYSVPIGRTITLKMTVTPKKNLKVEWSSSDESVATVSSKGVVKGISEGNAHITVKSVDNPLVSTTCMVTVVKPVNKIVFADKSISLAVDTSWKPKISFEPIDVTNKTISWSSSNEKVAKVNPDGKITGIGKGSATITVIAKDGGGAKASVRVVVDNYDLVFRNTNKQTGKFNYQSGKYTVTWKSEAGRVTVGNIAKEMDIKVNGRASSWFDIIPIRPGADKITVTAGKTRTVISVYVAQNAFDVSSLTNQESEESQNPVTTVNLKFSSSEYGKSNKSSLFSSPFVIFLILIIVVAIIGTVIQSLKPKFYNIESELAAIDKMRGLAFENWSAQLLKNLGYRDVSVTKGSGDYGADIVCYDNGDKAVVQCKRYQKNVGISPIQEILGARIHYRASKMIVMTNSHFTQAAIKLASESGVALWDRGLLRNKMGIVNNMYAKSVKDEKKKAKSIGEQQNVRVSVPKKVDQKPGNVISYIYSESPPRSPYGVEKHDYEITIKRLHDYSTYTLYRTGSNEQEALSSVYKVINVNENVIAIKEVNNMRKQGE